MLVLPSRILVRLAADDDFVIVPVSVVIVEIVEISSTQHSTD